MKVNQSLACTDPQQGDSVTKGSKTRTVTQRFDSNEIEYVTEKGVKRSCWISTWMEWCRNADSAITAGQKKEPKK